MWHGDLGGKDQVSGGVHAAHAMMSECSGFLVDGNCKSDRERPISHVNFSNPTRGQAIVNKAHRQQFAALRNYTAEGTNEMTQSIHAVLMDQESELQVEEMSYRPDLILKHFLFEANNVGTH